MTRTQITFLIPSPRRKPGSMSKLDSGFRRNDGDIREASGL